METALGELKRQDCERENECLSQLAGKANTLYAIYTNLDFDVKKQIVGSARIVREDGVQIATAKTQPAALSKRSFVVAAKDVLSKLVDQLDVKSLPATRPKPPEPAPVVLEPPPPPPEVSIAAPAPAPARPSGLKTVGIIAVAGGGAVLAAGAVVSTLGTLSARQLDEGQNVIPREGESVFDAARSYRTSQNLQTPGLVLVGAGAAVAVTGAILLLVAPSSSPSTSISIGPLPGGAAVAFTGALP
jgi:hypothetical protein